MDCQLVDTMKLKEFEIIITRCMYVWGGFFDMRRFRGGGWIG